MRVSSSTIGRWIVGIGCAVVASFVLFTFQQRAISDEPDLKPSGRTKEEVARPYCSDWPKPAMTFFITGRQYGYIEPCGCTGLEFQKGGLARRKTLYNDLVGRGWDIIPIDLGNQVRRFGPQAAIKFATTMSALKDMDYKAVGLGPHDLRIESGELISEIVDETPLVSSNVMIAGLPVSGGHKIIKSGKYRIGIASVMGENEQRGIRSPDIEFKKPAQAVAEAHAQFTKAKCSLMVLLCYASTEETKAIAMSSAQARDFRVVITAGGADEPALEPIRIPGTRSFMVQTGKKGMYVGVLGVFPASNVPMRYERIPLDKRFKDSPDVLQSLTNYQQQLETIYKKDWSKLVMKPVDHPTGRKFLGSAACQDCHETAYEKWLTTPHHEATHSISNPTERSDIPRHFDPECLSCHVTGWNAQDYYPYVSGYTELEASKHLHGNGCENCHGPGSAHVAAENGDDDLTDAQIESIRKSMVLPLASAQERCLTCHDLDNDPNFHEEGAFEKYWKQIEHYED